MCECKICNYSKDVKKVLDDKDPDKMALLITELMNNKSCVEADNEYYQAILDGSWPSSVEILETALEKAKKKQSDIDSAIAAC